MFLYSVCHPGVKPECLTLCTRPQVWKERHKDVTDVLDTVKASFQIQNEADQQIPGSNLSDSGPQILLNAKKIFCFRCMENAMKECPFHVCV